ncbi:hypothetical protein J2X31_000946 [Flavobacterium arsenatis]|uniref:Peptidase M56 domain-containing protein n=1 Tax=Flavobacterium arsenatis TaxID=1484332 RepID=A0ABU1TLV1_9FLAO|nr:hypothetical protein [Flavobacterium arsenatis]
MFVIVTKYLIPKGYNGLTLFPFIMVRNDFDKANKVLINHEKIHIKQQMQLLVFPFLIWYMIEFLFRWFQFKDRNKAYRNISFEREAYANEQNLNYINEMRFWSFHNYLKK